MADSVAHPKSLRVAIVGTGPAGLMAAEVLSAQGFSLTLFEQRKGPSWKLYIAGSSGLNISNSLPLAAMLSHYTGPTPIWKTILEAFGPQEWLRFIESELGLGTFLGTSQRYFVETMHAAALIRVWRRRLEQRGVSFCFDHSCTGLEASEEGWRLSFSGQPAQDFAAVGFALGGASYEKSTPSWPEIFLARGAQFNPFASSNAGYELAWPEALVQEAEGKPLKNIELSNARGKKRGDLILTAYGLEGTPIYFLGSRGAATLDLKPDLSLATVEAKLQRKTRENFSLLRRAPKALNLSPGAQALLFHLLPEPARRDPRLFAQHIKALPLELLRPRPLSESISSSGGVSWDSVTANLMLQNHPGIFLAGEMLDWDAPTGGFLIQACVSQGHWIGQQLALHCRTLQEARCVAQAHVYKL